MNPSDDPRLPCIYELIDEGFGHLDAGSFDEAFGYTREIIPSAIRPSLRIEESSQSQTDATLEGVYRASGYIFFDLES